MNNSRPPDLIPVLSRGKHRSPRKGACFMELASYLAGERWSDHPRCTHPLLAAMAREVNDNVGDVARLRLAPLIPDVIGLTGNDPRLDASIARLAALAALPVVSDERQGVAAVGLLRCERMLNHLDGRPRNILTPEAQAALDDVPRARDWAQSFSAMGWGSNGSFTRRSAPAIVHCAVTGIAASTAANAETLLVDLLERTIVHCRESLQHEARKVAAEQWLDVCELTRR
jgi:hypothetical protein